MRHVTSLILHLYLIAAFGAPVLAQDAPPKEAFKAVHLVNLKSPADVAALQAALADLNKAMANAGYPDIRYRLYKVVGKHDAVAQKIGRASCRERVSLNV